MDERGDPDEGIVAYSRRRIKVVVTLIVLTLITVLLVLPIYVLWRLNHSSKTGSSIGVIMLVLLLFTLAFSLILMKFTRAKRHDILAAAAAWVLNTLDLLSGNGWHSIKQVLCCARHIHWQCWSIVAGCACRVQWKLSFGGVQLPVVIPIHIHVFLQLKMNVCIEMVQSIRRMLTSSPYFPPPPPSSYLRLLHHLRRPQDSPMSRVNRLFEFLYGWMFTFVNFRFLGSSSTNLVLPMPKFFKWL